MGDYAAPLASVHYLVGIEHVARALVGVREWLPNLKDVTGRGIEVCVCVCVCPFSCMH